MSRSESEKTQEEFMSMLKITLMSLLSFCLLSSCGKFTKVVSHVQVEQTLDNGEAFISLEADLDLGNMSLPIDFKRKIELPGKGVVGELQLKSDKILIDINVTALAPNMNTQAELPNGAELPLIGLNPVVVLPVRGTQIEVYLSLVNGASAVGVSIPIKELDKIGRYSAFFPRFKLGQVLLSAGIYSNDFPGESGMGAFFDITKVLQGIVEDSSSGQSYEYVTFAEGHHSFDYDTEENSKTTQRKIDKVIHKLHRKRKVLTVE